MSNPTASAYSPAAPSFGATLGSISGERQLVTALFYDLVGSTELLTSLDAEDFADLQRAVHEAVAAAIRTHSGHLERIQGDGGCAYFGLPTAFEGAAECAILAALEIIRSCGRVSSGIGAPLRVRVGIASGSVVIADAGSAGLPLDKEVIGVSPALAARIQSEAQPDTIAVCEDTYRLTSAAFDYEPLGEHRLKGFIETLRLWKPIRRRAHLDRFSSSRRTTTRFTGRAGELEVCRRRLQQAFGGSGQAVFIHGEAGIGKSRLVYELRNEVTGVDCDVRVLQCLPRGNTRPLHPFLDELNREINGTSSDGARPDRQSIKQHVESHYLALSVAAQELLAFLFGREGEPLGGGFNLMDGSADQMRGSVVTATVELIEAWSRLKPQIIVIEDLHWADTLTHAVVECLAGAIRLLPVFIMVTSREAIPTHLTGDNNVAVLGLSRLAEAEIAQMLNSVWDGAPPAGLARFIHERTDGVPLFAEELGFLLKEQARGPGASVQDWQRILREGNVLNLQDLVAARLAGLGELRRVAQIASVIGREFNLSAFSRLVDDFSLPVQVGDALQELVHAGILRRRAASGGTEYQFRHVLIQEGAYNSLLKRDRRTLHEAILVLMRSGVIASPPDDLLAWHYSQAGRLAEAAEHAIRAAESCLVRSAMHEADRLLGFAREQLDRANGSSPELTDLRIQLLAASGPVAASLFGRGAERTRKIYEEGVSLCRNLGEEDRHRWFPLYWGWWFTAPDYETQRARSNVLVRDLETTLDPEVRLQALHCAWATNFDAGQHEYCLRCVGEGLTLYDEERARKSRAKYGGHDAKICALGERALSSWFVGDELSAEASLDAMMLWAERIAHLDSTLHALDYSASLMRYKNCYTDVVKSADRMGEIAAEHALPGAKAKAMLFRGWARALSGELENGAAEFADGLALQREVGTEENLSVFRDMEAEILAHGHSFEEALGILDETIVTSNRSGQVFWIPELYRRRAQLRRLLGQDVSAAIDDLESALRLSDSHGARSLALRASHDIQRLRAEIRR